MNFPIDKNLILKKLDILLELLEGIELEGIEDDNTLHSNHNELFSGQLVTALTLKNMIKHDTYKQDGYSVVQIMKDVSQDDFMLFARHKTDVQLFFQNFLAEFE